MGQSIDCRPHFGHQVGRRKASYANHAAQVEKTAVCLLSDRLLGARFHHAGGSKAFPRSNSSFFQREWINGARFCKSLTRFTFSRHAWTACLLIRFRHGVPLFSINHDLLCLLIVCNRMPWNSVHEGGHILRREQLVKFLPVLAVIILLLSACATGGTTTPTITQTGPVKIGVSVSLTGDASADGQAIKQGYEVWADYVNSHGGLLGHQVQMIYYDDATRPEQATINYTKLIQVDKVNFVLGPFDDAFTVNGAEVAKKYGYAFIQGTGTSPQDFTHGLTNMFSVSLSASRYMSSLVQYILSLPANMRPKTAAYVTSDDGFTSAQVVPAVTALEDNGNGLKTVVNKIYPVENTDLNPIAASVVASHADVAILGTSALSECVAYLKYFKTQHYNPQILIATSGPDQGSAFTQAIGVKNAEGVLVANGGWWPTIKTYQNADFVTAFIKKYGGGPNDIGSDSVQAFSVGQVLQQTIDQTHSLDNGKIIQALHSGTFQSLQGPVAFTDDGQNDLAVPYLFQWQSGQLIPVYPQANAQANLEFPKPAWSS